jgi:hypothetical protein
MAPKADRADVLADANKRLKADLDQLSQEHAAVLKTLALMKEKQAEEERAKTALLVRPES